MPVVPVRWSRTLPSTPDVIPVLTLRTLTRDAITTIEVGGPAETGQGSLGSIPAREPAPQLPVSPNSVEHVVALDVLEAVLDEEAWLDAIATALIPGGTATFRLPLEGPVAWLDALNLYRYTQDIVGAGKQLKETKLKGWHRHYRPAELSSLFERHGFVVEAEEREGNPAIELAQFGALVWGGMIQGTTTVEDDVRSWREASEDRSRLSHLGPISTRITITARNAESG